jgi:hypothetical protein
MRTQKVIREKLGLSQAQMGFICGVKEEALRSAERRKVSLSGTADEVFLAYFDYVEAHGESGLESLNGYTETLFELKASSLESQIRKARRRLVGLRKRHEGAVNKYRSSLESLKGISLLKEVVKGKSVDLRDRVEAARLVQIRKLVQSQFDTVVLYKIRLEWTIAEIETLAKMLDDGSIV